jgi:hypothetical protein
MSAGFIGGILGLLCGIALGFGVFLLSKLYVDQMPHLSVLQSDAWLYSIVMKFGFVIAMTLPAWIGWSMGVVMFGGK